MGVISKDPIFICQYLRHAANHANMYNYIIKIVITHKIWTLKHILEIFKYKVPSGDVITHITVYKSGQFKFGKNDNVRMFPMKKNGGCLLILYPISYSYRCSP